MSGGNCNVAKKGGKRREIMLIFLLLPLVRRGRAFAKKKIAKRTGRGCIVVEVGLSPSGTKAGGRRRRRRILCGALGAPPR